MRTHVALLRGINVGGRNRVAMTDLRQIATSLGHTDVATYIQSGNVVFTSTGTDTITLADALEQEIARRLDVKPGVVVLSRDQLAGVIAGNPYPQAGDPRCLHAVFRREDMSPEESAAVVAAQQRASDKDSRDEAAVARGTLFLHTPDGLGRSELAGQLARSRIGTGTGLAGTARNWATVTRLLALLDELSLPLARISTPLDRRNRGQANSKWRRRFSHQGTVVSAGRSAWRRTGE